MTRSITPQHKVLNVIFVLNRRFSLEPYLVQIKSLLVNQKCRKSTLRKSVICFGFSVKFRSKLHLSFFFCIAPKSPKMTYFWELFIGNRLNSLHKFFFSRSRPCLSSDNIWPHALVNLSTFWWGCWRVVVYRFFY